MANTSIFAAFERMWQHVVSALGKKQNKALYITISGDDINGHTFDKTKEEIEEAYNSGADLYVIVPCIAEAPHITDAEGNIQCTIPLQSVVDGCYRFSGTVHLDDTRPRFCQVLLGDVNGEFVICDARLITSVDNINGVYPDDYGNVELEMPEKLTDLENDLYYSRSATVLSLTQADFAVDETTGVYFAKGTPVLDLPQSSEGISYTVIIYDASGSVITGQTQETMPITYDYLSFDYYGSNVIQIANKISVVKMVSGEDDCSGDEWAVMFTNNFAGISTLVEQGYTFSIEVVYNEVKKIPADVLDVDLATLEESIAETKTAATSAQNTANSKMNKTNPTGTGSFSLNRKANTTIGGYSFASGYNTAAIGNYSHAEGYNTAAIGNCSHAEGYNTTASVESAHAEGVSSNKLPDTITSSSTNDEIISTWETTKFTLAKGEASHAEGLNTLALKNYSHAEGENTIASGVRSHAEGDETTASGNSSHAEGIGSEAIGACSHAEGIGSEAIGAGSHAEGSNTTANGDYSHTEGHHAITNGDYSHAEGVETVASSNFQHVQGKYNIEDSEDKYAHIVGNGDSITRSNAHTLDWDGNAWFAGTVYVGGNSQDDGASEVALKSDIVQADLSQNDPSEPDYVKGRTHGIGLGYKPLFAQHISVASVGKNKRLRPEFEFVVGKKYKVIIDNSAYEQISYLDADGYVCVGAPFIDDDTEYDYSVYPFALLKEPDAGKIVIQHGTLTEYNVEIYVEDEVINKLDSKYVHTPNWGASEGEDGYILSRTHYSEITDTNVLFDGMMSIRADYNREINLQSTLLLGKTYRVRFDDSEYVVNSYEDDYGSICIGANLNDDAFSYNFIEYPFVVYDDSDVIQIVCETEGLHTIYISECEEVVHKLNEKYLPDSIKTTAETAQSTANTAKTTAETAQSTASVKMNKTDPTGTGSFSLNRKSGTTIGTSSFASGISTTASGNYSHAENNGTTASGINSHAEGAGTTASNYAAHSEGNLTTASGQFGSHAEGSYTTASGKSAHAENNRTTASGDYSHAEGYYTTASGMSAHAEGCSVDAIPDTITSSSTNDEIITTWNTDKFTLAKGNYSHAEGYNILALSDCSHAEGYETIAKGSASHAEGWSTIADGVQGAHAEGWSTSASGSYSHAEGRGTIAASEAQHVQGCFNIQDSTLYAHIVGNGIQFYDDSTGSWTENRSNAHTLDWDGNAWFAGDVYVGSTSGTNKDDGSKKLATVDDAKIFYITIATNNDSYTTDKSYEEILAAYNSGRTLVCKYPVEEGLYYELPLLIHNDGLFTFLFNDGDLVYNVDISSVDGETSVYVYESQAKYYPTAVKNPYALTINGTSYDGSEAVEVKSTFIITLSLTDGVYTSDKTISEIETAYDGGKVIYCHAPVMLDSGSIIDAHMRLSFANDLFFFFEGLGSGGAGYMTIYSGAIGHGGEEGVIAVNQYKIAKYDSILTEDEINTLIDAKLGVIENGSY